MGAVAYSVRRSLVGTKHWQCNWRMIVKKLWQRVQNLNGSLPGGPEIIAFDMWLLFDGIKSPRSSSDAALRMHLCSITFASNILYAFFNWISVDPFLYFFREIAGMISFESQGVLWDLSGIYPERSHNSKPLWRKRSHYFIYPKSRTASSYNLSLLQSFFSFFPMCQLLNSSARLQIKRYFINLTPINPPTNVSKSTW